MGKRIQEEVTGQLFWVRGRDEMGRGEWYIMHD